jgi:hypothetical protein
LKLAVIMTMYGRHENTYPLIERVLTSSKIPDEIWIMCDGQDDFDVASAALDKLWRVNVTPILLPTPRDGDRYAVIPYSNKINYVLDRTKADAIVYVDNGSMPSETKFEVMLKALLDNPDWGAVYCTQQRTGYREETNGADRIIPDGYGILNYTQVMHRPTTVRWTTDMGKANPDLADAIFWRDLGGPFYPVDGQVVHDTHHMNSAAAEGVI